MKRPDHLDELDALFGPATVMDLDAAGSPAPTSSLTTGR